MGFLFSKPKQSKKPAPGNTFTSADEAKLEAKRTRDKLTKYQKQLENESTQYQAAAKEMLAKGNRTRAALFLKLRKSKMQRCETMDNQLLNILQTIDSIDLAQQNAQIYQTIKQANSCLKEMKEALPLEEVERVMSEAEELGQYVNEVSRVLGEDISGMDADVEAELTALEEEEGLQPATATSAAAAEEKKEEEAEANGAVTHGTADEEIDAEAAAALADMPAVPIHTPVLPAAQASARQTEPEAELA